MTRTMVNPTTGLRRRWEHRSANRRVQSKCLSVEQRRVLMLVQMSIAETLEATQKGTTFMIAAHLVCQEILRDTWEETPAMEVILDSMNTIHEQMVNSAIAFHYYNALDESMGDVPVEEDNQPTYYRPPTITRIDHFQNEDKARNMADTLYEEPAT
jgi:hypothetical protein